MARREWAQKIIAKYERKDDWGIECVSSTEVQRLLLKEHARAVRIVKAEIRRIRQLTKTYNDVERIIIEVVLDRVLDKLQKGRA